jgi:hypothetical protein
VRPHGGQQFTALDALDADLQSQQLNCHQSS